MVLVGKTAFLAVLLCAAAVSAICEGSVSCAEEADETSLVQLANVLVHRGDNKTKATKKDKTEKKEDGGADEGSVEDEAEEKLHGLDKGEVDKTFKSNFKKERHEIESKATSDIDFNNQVREERKVDHQKALDRVKAARKSYSEALKKDREEVEKVKDERKSVVKEAIEGVKQSKEDYEAHRIKREQVDRASRLGRYYGAIEGRTAAQRAWEDYDDHIRKERMKEHDAKVKQRTASHEKAVKKSTKEATERIKKHDEAWADSVEKAIERAKAHAAASAATEEDRIAGAEGLRNTIDKIRSEWGVKHYDRASKFDQDGITEASGGHLDSDRYDGITEASGGHLDSDRYGLEGTSDYINWPAW